MASRLPRNQRLPPPRLPWLYFGTAHIALIVASATLALRPSILGEFFYHSRALAVVHLVTLGWITGSIIGALYLLGPIAWRARIPAGRIDAIAFALWSIGTLGLVSHFWIDSYSGMVWSAASVVAGLVLVGARVVPVLVRSPVAAAFKVHVLLGFANIVVAGTFGALIGLEKLAVLTLPGPVLGSVYAHAHLAAVGWALMIVMGAGYRLLPMFLPAAMPAPSGVVASAVLLEAGVLALFVSLALDLTWTPVAAAVVTSGVLVFGVQVVGMLRNRRPRPRGLQLPDIALGHSAQAFAYLLAAVALGLYLLTLPDSSLKLRLAAVYGVIALLGFLSQLVVGIASRLLPMVAWMRAFVDAGFVEPSRSQYRLLDRALQWAVLALWTLSVPIIAAGVAVARDPAIAVGAFLLFAGVALDAANRVTMSIQLRQGAATRRVTSPAAPDSLPGSPPGS